MISLLAFNHLSLVQNGLPTLKEMSCLHSLSRNAISVRQIEGTVALDYQPATQWLTDKPFATFMRGLEIRLTLDEDVFVNTGMHWLIRVLNHSFGPHVRMNSSVQSIAVLCRTGKELVKCTPHNGESTLV